MMHVTSLILVFGLEPSHTFN